MLPERERTAKARGVLWGYFEPLGWCCWDFEALGGGGVHTKHFFDLLKWPEV